MGEDILSPVFDIVHNEQNSLRAFLCLEKFYRLAAEQRAAIREGWDFGRRWFIPGLDYSDRDRITFAPLGGNDENGLDAQARIEARLTYHAIQNARYDFRDNIIDIALCYHSALASGLNVFQLFAEAAAVADKEMAGWMLGFRQWQPEDKSLWAFGFRQVPLENGIAFEWIGNDKEYDTLRPKHLDSLGREVKD